MNGVIPIWLVGNPYGPIPYDPMSGTHNKYFYIDMLGERQGPFDTIEEAKKARTECLNLTAKPTS